MIELIDDKIKNTEAAIAGLNSRLIELKKQRESVNVNTGIEKWLNNNFESSSSTTPEFAEFAKDFHNYLRDHTSRVFKVVNFSRGHFYVSLFLQHRVNGKYVYISISDVRYFKNDWYNNVLIRTATGPNDYTGGRNVNTTLPEIADVAIELTL